MPPKGGGGLLALAAGGGGKKASPKKPAFKPLSPEEKEALRKRLVKFYNKYAPTQMEKLDNALNAKMSEAALFKKLRETYSVKDGSPGSGPETDPLPDDDGDTNDNKEAAVAKTSSSEKPSAPAPAPEPAKTETKKSVPSPPTAPTPTSSATSTATDAAAAATKTAVASPAPKVAPAKSTTATKRSTSSSSKPGMPPPPAPPSAKKSTAKKVVPAPKSSSSSSGGAINVDDPNRIKRITKFYRRYAPPEDQEKLDVALNMKASEELIFQKLRAKYNIDANAPGASPTAVPLPSDEDNAHEEEEQKEKEKQEEKEEEKTKTETKRVVPPPPPPTTTSVKKSTPPPSTSTTSPSTPTTSTAAAATGATASATPESAAAINAYELRKSKVLRFYKAYVPESEYSKAENAIKSAMSEEKLFDSLRRKYGVATGSPGSGPGTQPLPDLVPDKVDPDHAPSFSVAGGGGPKSATAAKKVVPPPPSSSASSNTVPKPAETKKEEEKKEEAKKEEEKKDTTTATTSKFDDITSPPATKKVFGKKSKPSTATAATTATTSSATQEEKKQEEVKEKEKEKEESTKKETTTNETSNNDGETTTTVTTTKKVFGKKAKPSSPETSEKKDEKSNETSTTTTAAATTNEDGTEAVQEVKATKKVFGKKAAATAKTSTNDAGDESTKAKEEEEKKAATSTSTSTTTDSSDKKNDNDVGETVQEVKATKKVFAKKSKKTTTDSDSAASASAANSNVSSVVPSQTTSVNPSETGSMNIDLPQKKHPSPLAPIDLGESNETENNNNTNATTTAPTTATKKSWGKKKTSALIEEAEAGDDGEKEKEASSATTNDISSPTSPSVSYKQIEDTTDPVEKQRLLEIRKSQHEERVRLEKEHEEKEARLRPSPHNPLSTAAGNWDDWFDEVCRVVARLTSTNEKQISPQLLAKKGGPTMEEINEYFPALIPSSRTVSWLLVERRMCNEGVQRVPLLWRAAAAGWFGIVGSVLSQCDKQDSTGVLAMRVLQEEASEDGTSALYVAAQNGHREICELISSAAKHSPHPGLFRNVLNHQRRTGATPLFIATQARHLEVVEFLLSIGAECEIANHQRASPLVLSCSMDSGAIVETLLMHGANWRDRRTGRSPLMWSTGPKARAVLESFLMRRCWFLKWRNRADAQRQERNKPPPEPEAPKHDPLAALYAELKKEKHQNLAADHPHHTETESRDAEAEAVDEAANALLMSMMLARQRKQMKEFLTSFNDERSLLVSLEHDDRKKLSFEFTMAEPPNMGNPNMNALYSNSNRIFSPELQPTPYAYKSMLMRSSHDRMQQEQAMHHDPHLSSQHMLGGIEEAMKESEGMAAPAHLKRPTIESIVRTLNKEKEDLANKKQPTTRFGLPVNNNNNNNGGGGRVPVPSKTPQVIPAVTTPEAAKLATNIDWSRRREFEWDARLHRIAKLDSAPDSKMYRLPDNNNNNTSSKNTNNNNSVTSPFAAAASSSARNFDERKPLAPPPKGVRKAAW